MSTGMNFLTDEQVVVFQQLLDWWKARKAGTSDYHEAPENLNAEHESNNHFVLTPLTGIPGRVGTLLGHALCIVFKPVETSYGSGEFNLVAVTHPSGAPYKIDVYNASEQPVEYGFYTVDRERYGVYAIHMVKGALVLVEAKECLLPDEKDKEAYLYKLTESGWVKTDTVIELSDRLDANMLVPGEKVFAMPVGPTKYDIVGSHGLYRWARPNASFIECNGSGSATIYVRQAEDPPPEEPQGCGTVTWYQSADESWFITANNCEEGCVPVWPDPNGPSPQEVPCQGSADDPPIPDDDRCGLKTTDCVVDICNSLAPNRCYKTTEWLRIRYMGKKKWEVLPFKRNSLYIAAIAGEMCGQGINEDVEITGAQPLEFCMSDEELQAITSAKNRFNLQGANGDYVLIVEDLTKCEGDNFYIAQVMHKCRYVPVDETCSGAGEEPAEDQKFLRQKPDECVIEGQMLQMAIQTCKSTPTWKEQIELTEYELLYGASLYFDDETNCTIYLDGFSQRICALPASGSPPGTLDLGSVQFYTREVIANPLLEMDSGQGTGTDLTCMEPMLLLKGQKYDAIVCPVPYPEPEYEVLTTLPLYIQDALVEVSQRQGGCPYFVPETFIVFAFCKQEPDVDLTCDDCTPPGTGTA